MKMTDQDLEEMSLDELKSLQTRVNRAIESYEERRRKEARAALEAKAKEFGFSLNEITGAQKKTTGARPPKFRHPEDPTLTWSGRGRQPQWYKDALASGMTEEDLRIS